MSSANGFQDRVRSLREMLELNANSFLAAVTQLRHLIVVMDRIEDKNLRVGPEDRENFLLPHVTALSEELGRVNARSALASINRLRKSIEDAASPLTYTQVQATLNDIESRFSDHVSDVKLFVLNEYETTLFDSADQLLGTTQQPIEGFSRAFPNASFEIEEAAKCIALGRHTACVFHCMRALEHGIKSMCKLLDVPDASKPADKNWAIILRAIKVKLDEKWPSNTRLPETKGAQLEKLYATLDAIKNPWRNATMHVESVYAPHEALHIARCTGIFMLELMKHCDEEGLSREESPAKVTVSETPSASGAA